jgi:ferredoxin
MCPTFLATGDELMVTRGRANMIRAALDHRTENRDPLASPELDAALANCLSCKACVSIGFQKSLSPVEVDTQRCSGCGICAYACNYHAATLVKLDGKVVSKTDMFKCKSCGMCVVACPSEARSMVDDDTAVNIARAYASLS